MRTVGSKSSLVVFQVLMALAIAFGGDDAAAQQPRVSVAEEIKLVEGEPRPLSITIAPDQSVPAGGRVVILKLEAPLTFSAGSADSEFGWRLSLSELSGLKVSSRSGMHGQWVIVVGLVDESGKLLASASSLVTIEPSNKAPEAPPGSPPVASSSPSPPTGVDTQEQKRLDEERQRAEAQRKADEERREAEAREKLGEERRRQAEALRAAEEERLRAEAQRKADEERRQAEARQKADEQRREAEAREKSSEERRQAEARRTVEEERQRAEAHLKATNVQSAAERLVSRGEQQLARGNVANAREFFRRAADAGHAQAALLMGDTFNTAELARYGVVGIQPDLKEASRWYEKARDLGASTAAMERLERLKKR